MSYQYSYPSSLKQLRACTQCRLIKTENQFKKEGCENCGINPKEILQYITPHFKGMIAVMDPKYSWAARWLNLSKKLFYFII